MLATAMAARHNRVSPCEARAFRAVNGLPDPLHPPAWVIMQLGTLGAAPAAAGVAWLAGDRKLAARFLAGGAGTWALSKLVKRMVRRHRPVLLLPGTRHRGATPPAWGTCPGTPVSPPPSALLPFPTLAQPAAPSPWAPFPPWA